MPVVQAPTRLFLWSCVGFFVCTSQNSQTSTTLTKIQRVLEYLTNGSTLSSALCSARHKPANRPVVALFPSLRRAAVGLNSPHVAPRRPLSPSSPPSPSLRPLSGACARTVHVVPPHRMQSERFCLLRRNVRREPKQRNVQTLPASPSKTTAAATASPATPRCRSSALPPSALVSPPSAVLVPLPRRAATV